MSATARAAALRAGDVTARNVAAAHLDMVAQLDPTLHAMISVDASAVIQSADRRDALPLHQRGALHGVPVVIKDLTDTKGLRTTYGSSLFADHVPAEDDLVVARLRAAGAVILGNSNTPEFGFNALCQNALCGPKAATQRGERRLSAGSADELHAERQLAVAARRRQGEHREADEGYDERHRQTVDEAAGFTYRPPLLEIAR